MNKLFNSLITLIILSTLCGSLNADAQVPSEHVVTFPHWDHLYYDSKTPNIYGENSNIDMFFSEWEEWSLMVANGAAPSEYNSIFTKHFLKEHRKKRSKAKYLSVPLFVKVIKYNYSLNPDSIKDLESFFHSNHWKKNKLPDSISYFTPIIKSNKKVLYLLPEAEELLSAFINEPTMTPFDSETFRPLVRKDEITEEEWEELRKRRDMIGQYVPTVVAHWGNKWFFSSYPLIRSIVVWDDGYYIEWSYADYSGQACFVPLDGDPIVFESWVQ